MHKKPPVIKGRMPDNRFDLDDDSQLSSLGLNLEQRGKIADEYDHYPDCNWAVIEYKSNSLRNGVEQLEETAEKLVNVQKKVNYAIIVAKRINRAERRIFQKRGNVLYNKLKNTPIQIRVDNKKLEVSIYEVHEVDKQYKAYSGSLWKWASK